MRLIPPPPPPPSTPHPKKTGWAGVNLQIYTSKSDFFSFFAIFTQKLLNIAFCQVNPWFWGVWVRVLGVRVRIKGVLYWNLVVGGYWV